MLLKSFSIDSLFGTFNYELGFADKSSLMVLTGLNGYGKTTILRILSSLSSKNGFYYLYEVPFKTIRVVFDNETRLVVSKDKTKGESVGDEVTDALLNTRFSFYKGKKLLVRYEINNEKYISSDYYRNISKSKKENPKEDYNGLRLYFPLFSDEDKLEKLIMNLSVFNTTLISSQRLLNEDKKGKSHQTINEVNERMSLLLSEAYLKYMERAQELDGHQIDELLSDDAPQLSEEEYKSKSMILEMLAKELVSYNLLPQLNLRSYNPQKTLISSVYINTLERKLEEYDDIRRKLRLFLELLNNKDFVNKHFGFSRREGLRVLLKTGGVLNDLTKLSSGEQNEIYLLFKFIFEVPDKSVLLIDEPELSLHVAWQLQFINDIKKIAKARDIQIVIATHSPEIVSESMDCCIDLTEMSNAR
jgi:predicted ATPase